MKKTSGWLCASWLLFAIAVMIGCAEGEDSSSSIADSGKPFEGGKIVEAGTTPNDGNTGAGGADQDAKMPSEGGSGGGGPVDPRCMDVSLYSGGLCGTCMVEKCARKCDDCLNNPGCVSYIECRSTCRNISDETARKTCEGKCAAANRSGASIMFEWEGYPWSCIGQQCWMECTNTSKPACGAIFNETSSCGACINSKCGAQCNACFAEPQCQYYWACSSGCAYDKACLANCKARYPLGEPLFNALLDDSGACINNSCKTECTVTCSNIIVSGSCATCNTNNCSSQCQTCLSQSECLDLLYCIDSCYGDEQCGNNCLSDYSAGVSAMDSWLGNSGCLHTYCASACGN